MEPKGTEGIDKVNKRVHALKVQGVNLAAALNQGRKASTTSADSYREGAAEWLLHWGFKNANRSHSSAPAAVTPSTPSAPDTVDPRLAALVVQSN
ncbi:hypothetical protein Lsed01_00845 [Demequina sediminis]|uniref:Uncharacterized protein n=1 Tax=Demequina sediminis TaxID=1930058 RepID=A0ABP9WGR9_9MICO